MLEQAFFNVYTKFKLHFYQEIFRRFQTREASLTTVETFCMETIQALGRPTISEFAAFMRISLPNATYKVNSLVKKGYIQKKQSQEDQREYHLEVTQKYLDYYSISVTYMVEVMNRISRRFSSEECAKLEEMLRIAGGYSPQSLNSDGHSGGMARMSVFLRRSAPLALRMRMG